jgi:hypothetical protein
MSNDDDLRFALQMAGSALASTPPSPDSPLGRLRLFAVANPEVKLGKKHVQAAVDGTLVRPS